jgi:hypothetical protein
MFEGTIRTRLRSQIAILLPFVFLFAVLGLISERALVSVWQGRWVVVVAACLWAAVLLPIMLVSKDLRFLRRLFKPVLKIGPNGLITSEGLRLPWSCVKEAVVFSHGGYEHFGLRLKENLTSVGDMPLQKFTKLSDSWSMYGMVCVFMIHTVSMRRQKILNIFKEQYHVPVRNDPNLLSPAGEES